MSSVRPFSFGGWPEGHPHLTTIDGYPFGYTNPTTPDPLVDNNRDGYASSFRRLYQSYKRRATKAGLEFNLTKEDFYYLTSQPCFYCAAPPSQGMSRKGKKTYIYNGLDRDESDRGYALDNCRPCCWKHNRLKGKHSMKEFYRLALMVVLSISSKTALDLGDLECLDLLIKLYPNVRFLREHRLAAAEDIRRRPNEPRWNWLCQPVRAIAP